MIAGLVLRRADLLAEFLRNDEIQADALFQRSEIEARQGNFPRATELCCNFTKLYRRIGETFKEARAVSQAGTMLIAQQLFEKAKSMLLRSLDLVGDAPGSEGLLAPTYEELAMISMRSPRFAEAARYYERAAECREKLWFRQHRP